MRKRYKIIIIFLVLFISIGFSYLTANLDITGSITFKDNVWDVHLENIVVENDSIEADTPTITNNDTVNFSISMNRPGDYYEFYVDVVNAGTMDATLDTITKTTLTGDYAIYLEYTTTYYSDREFIKGDLLRVGQKERIKVRVEYKYDLSNYKKLDNITLSLSLKYIKTDTHDSTYNKNNWLFDSKAEEDIFVVPKTGTYKLEVWGAQGGSVSETLYGGYGGYSVGIVSFSKNTIIYINVGEVGKCEQNGLSVLGGYNGGGAAKSIFNEKSDYIMCSGGGASSISSKSGLLKTLSSNVDKIFIVSGGGGGAGSLVSAGNSKGGNAGGYIGSVPVNSCKDCGTRTGGSQTSGGISRAGTGSFGLGAGFTTKSSCGGGGGFYGGGGDSYEWGGTGGSGYIGNTNLTEKIMYCYGCGSSEEEADETHIKTRSTTNVSEIPTSNYAKIGHGYAKIAFIG